MKEIILKGLSTGVVAGISTGLFFEDAGTVALFGLGLNPAIVNAVASDLISENLIEKMNLPQNIISTEELILKSSVAGITSSAVMMIGAGVPSENLLKTFALGAGSKLAGDYAYDQLLSPQHGMLPIF